MSLPVCFKKTPQDYDCRKRFVNIVLTLIGLSDMSNTKPDKQSSERWENCGKQALIHCLLCNFYYMYL